MNLKEKKTRRGTCEGLEEGKEKHSNHPSKILNMKRKKKARKGGRETEREQ